MKGLGPCRTRRRCYTASLVGRTEEGRNSARKKDITTRPKTSSRHIAAAAAAIEENTAIIDTAVSPIALSFDAKNLGFVPCSHQFIVQACTSASENIKTAHRPSSACAQRRRVCFGLLVFPRMHGSRHRPIARAHPAMIRVQHARREHQVHVSPSYFLHCPGHFTYNHSHAF